MVQIKAVTKHVRTHTKHCIKIIMDVQISSNSKETYRVVQKLHDVHLETDKCRVTERCGQTLSTSSIYRNEKECPYQHMSRNI
jgi:hypothetical protein